MLRLTFPVIAALVLLAPLNACGDVQVETYNIPMRDGIRLATDVYRDEAVTRAPVILMRTPYDRIPQKANAER